MVVSSLNTSGVINQLNQSDLESPIHWRQSHQTSSPQNDQQNCILNFTSHDQRTSSPVQNAEKNSCYSSENGADNLSPSQQIRRSSGSDEISSLFPNSSQLCFDYSNSDNESSQASPLSFHDDDSFRASRKAGSSSSGKPKVRKCRSCGFSSIDKAEFWKHVETHLNPEKTLRCPQCPFVTPYKHHLDFHIQNHQGNKPYKCDKCAYECVNKSMLKSHLKSHSKVYQYKCHDCAYKTKYCHSLKIHLRKYQHSPGLVLDIYGNPNPNSVIDVYGNRRGPKQRGKKGQDNESLTLPTSIPTLNGFQNLPWNVFFPENSRIPVPILPNAALLNGPTFGVDTCPKPDITSQESDNLNNNLKLVINNNRVILNGHGHGHGAAGNNNDLFMANHNTNSLSFEGSVKKESTLSEDEEIIHQPEEEKPTTSSTFSFLLFDRAAPPAVPAATAAEPFEEAPLNLTVSHLQSTTGKTNRRKGVARRYPLVEEPEEAKNLSKATACQESFYEKKVKAEEQAENEVEAEAKTSNELLTKIKSKKDCFHCNYCEITFFDQIMFTMHMGYHGYSNPFTCNRCGEKTDDKIAFYVHMISAAHY